MDFIRDAWDDSKPMTILMGFLALIALALVGVLICGVFWLFAHTNGIHEGSVSEKGHHDAYSSVVCSGGKVTICTPVSHPESWDVTISKGEDSNTFSIPESKWNSISKGDYLTFDGETLASVK